MRWGIALCGLLLVSPFAIAQPPVGNNSLGTVGNNVTAANVSAPASTRPPSAPPKQGSGVLAFYANWMTYSNLSVSGIDFTGVDTVAWAFWTALKNGSIVSTDAYADFQAEGNGTIPRLNAAKQKYGFRTMLSIGGWSSSQNFSAVAANTAARKVFAQECLKACQDYGFDGVDLDWEYPRGGGLDQNYFSLGDGAFFDLLLKDLRAALGSQYLISIDVSLDISRYDGYTWSYGQTVDWINIMAFDFVGVLQPLAGHCSPLGDDTAGDPNKAGNVRKSVSDFLAAGVDPVKLTLLTPFYGKSWNVTSNDNNGLYQIVDTYDSDQVYRDLRANGWLPTSSTAGSGFTKTFWNSTQASTLLRRNSATSFTFVSYDDPSTITAKGQLAKQNGFGGVGMWEVSQDYQGEMLDALIAAFKQ